MKRFGIIVFVFGILFSWTALAGEIVDIKIETQDVTEQELTRVRNEATNAVETITRVLGTKKPKKIKIKITESGICRTSNGWILLPIKHTRNKTAAIYHEVTHILAKHEDNRFFSEGMAIYFQEKYGEDCGFPNFSCEELDAVLKRHSNNFVSIKKLSRDNQVFREVGTEKRKIAYIEAGSFFSFLVKNYGEIKLKDLHKSSSLNYKKVYGQKIDKLEEEWKNFRISRNSTRKNSNNLYRDPGVG
jgi:hypothetical protein